MRGRYSPPLSSKASKHDRPPPPIRRSVFPSRRTRIYILLSTILFLIYYTSPLPSLLQSHHHAPPHAPSLIHKNIDWSRYAYSQYATDSAYLCNAVMVFASLHRLGSKADRILFYPQEWDTDIADGSDRDSQLLVKARDWYRVKLIPVEIPKVKVKKRRDDKGKAKAQGHGDGEGKGGRDGEGGEREEEDGWEGGFTKFLNWREVQYDRILHIDSDVTILKQMDELFLLPDTAVAMFRAYWLLAAEQQPQQQRKLTSLLILLRPDETEYQRLMAASRADQRQTDVYDMEILNRFYGDSAMVLPHRQYGLLTGEFRRSADHSSYLGNGHERWNGDLVFREASVVHFSDWPLPKPWIMWPHQLIGEIMPKCRYGDSGLVDDCQDKQIWMGLYDDFRRRRKEVCALLSAPAPDWPPRHNKTGKGDG